jgi:DNA-binding transcriptional regulator GbsR (MarR family)
MQAAKRTFVERWSAMATSWGVPRSMAEVHALLFAEARPMSAEELMAALGISRGNASMTVRTLLDWGIVRRADNGGARRELYEAEQDVMALFSTVIRVRKQREVDPLGELVSACRAAASGASGADHAAFIRKLDDIEFFVQASDRLCAEMLGDRPQALRATLGRQGEDT